MFMLCLEKDYAYTPSETPFFIRNVLARGIVLSGKFFFSWLCVFVSGSIYDFVQTIKARTLAAAWIFLNVHEILSYPTDFQYVCRAKFIFLDIENMFFIFCVLTILLKKHR